MRLIEIVAHTGHSDTLRSIAEQNGATDVWWGPPDDQGRQTFRMLVSDGNRQAVMDALQVALGGGTENRILVLGVDTVLPREPTESDDTTASTREELYVEIEKGARLDSNYLLLVALSTIVVAVGLLEDSVAVVIGAMVIAPLLGPNLALAFATALGDRSLLRQALSTNVAGVGLAFVITFAIGMVAPVSLASEELLTRTDVGVAGIVLALASGAAAVLSLTTGLSATLVGVMVAVALLPPTAALGLLVGGGQMGPAAGAGLLLMANVVCVALAANIVFVAKGVRPRTWLQRRRARQSWTLMVGLWVALLIVVLLLIYLRTMLPG